MQNDWIAIWGAVISTILALIKIAEMWINHYRVSVTGEFNIHGRKENKIFITNLSSKSMIVNHWELEWRRGFWPFRNFIMKSKDGLPSWESLSRRRIDSFEHWSLPLSGEYYFKIHDDKKLYIKLYIAGKLLPKVVRVKK